MTSSEMAGAVLMNELSGRLGARNGSVACLFLRPGLGRGEVAGRGGPGLMEGVIPWLLEGWVLRNAYEFIFGGGW